MLAGALGGTGNLDGAGSEARFAGPQGLAVDAAGNLLVADAPNQRIRKVTRAGVVSTFAGTGQSGRADGSATTATFCNPDHLAIDPNGNLAVLDRGTVRKIAPDGTVTTVFGDVTSFCEAPLGPGPAPLTSPSALAFDAAGTLYIANTSPGAVYRLRPDGALTKLAGDSAVAPDGFGDLYGISALVVDAARNVYAAQGGPAGYRVRKITPEGTVTTLVPAAAGLRVPTSLALDRAGNLLIADSFNFVIRTASTRTGAVSTFAGIVGEPALQDGPPGAARFSNASNIAVDPATGSVYVSERSAGTIRKVDAGGNVTTVAGLATPNGPEFGSDLASDRAGNVYFSRYLAQAQGGFGPGLVLQQIAGGATTVRTVGNLRTQVFAFDGTGATYTAEPVAPTSNCPPFLGYLCESASKSQVVKVSVGGQVTTLPRTFPAQPNTDGSIPEFRNLTAIAADSAGNLYLGDDGFNSRPAFTSKLYRLTSAGVLSTLAVGDFQPRSLALDAAGNVVASLCMRTGLASSSGAAALQLVRYGPDGQATALAGSAAAGFGANDGPGPSATFGDCAGGGDGIAFDRADNLYLADTGNSLIRRITPQGMVSTVVGQPGSFGVRLGPLPGSLRFPTDVDVDSAGDLVIASQRAILGVRFAR